VTDSPFNFWHTAEKHLLAYADENVLTKAVVPDAITTLRALYTNPSRHYHNQYHLEFMFRDFEKLFPAEYGFEHRIHAAILFHDAVYIPGAGSNEERSTALAQAMIDPWSSTLDRLILATKHHHLSGRRDENIICDLDLMGLSQYSEGYKNSTALIRMECGAFTDDQWTGGRIDFLKDMLARPKIYATPECAEFESKARNNMGAELVELLEVKKKETKIDLQS
jgi:predicted metal-dependent HD superfamily phosphohydrolase